MFLDRFHTSSVRGWFTQLCINLTGRVGQHSPQLRSDYVQHITPYFRHAINYYYKI